MPLCGLSTVVLATGASYIMHDILPVRHLLTCQYVRQYRHLLVVCERYVLLPAHYIPPSWRGPGDVSIRVREA